MYARFGEVTQDGTAYTLACDEYGVDLLIGMLNYIRNSPLNTEPMGPITLLEIISSYVRGNLSSLVMSSGHRLLIDQILNHIEEEALEPAEFDEDGEVITPEESINLAYDLLDPEPSRPQAMPRPMERSGYTSTGTGGTTTARFHAAVRGIRANRDQPQQDDFTQHQTRLIAAVTPKSRLLAVRFEGKGSIRDAVYERYDDVRYIKWLIRKCPPHIAQRLVDFDKSEEAEENGYKAWEYVEEIGLRIRQM